jgi:hypothetical protein
MKPLTEQQRLNLLRIAIARAVTDLQPIARWRAECHDHDDDMGHLRRDFADASEWERMEVTAKAIKLALATAEPPLEVEDAPIEVPAGPPVCAADLLRQEATRVHDIDAKSMEGEKPGTGPLGSVVWALRLSAAWLDSLQDPARQTRYSKLPTA